LPDEKLKDLRLLTISDFDRKCPFPRSLAVPTALDNLLAEPIHHDLDQRITTQARLSPLGLDENRDYLNSQLAAAGNKGKPIFEVGAVDEIINGTGGELRRINNMATAPPLSWPRPDRAASSRQRTSVMGEWTGGAGSCRRLRQAISRRQLQTSLRPDIG